MMRGRDKSSHGSARPDAEQVDNDVKTRQAKTPDAPANLEGQSMSSEPVDLLKTIADMLASGLETEVEPFPETDKEFADILFKLRQLDPNDTEGKLVVGGFVDHPYGPEQQRCMECMYFLVHRKWCDLPELALPVEPEWWCRLWRI